MVLISELATANLLTTFHYSNLHPVRPGAVSMVVDKSIEQSNLISLIVEIVFGVILVL